MGGVCFARPDGGYRFAGGSIFSAWKLEQSGANAGGFFASDAVGFDYGKRGVVFLSGLFPYRRWDVQGAVLAYELPVPILASSLGSGYGGGWIRRRVARWQLGLWLSMRSVVVWAEKIERTDAKQAVERQTAIGALARELRVALVVGVQVEKRNVAWTFGADGGWIGEYQKQQLVPQLESDLERGHRFGVAVCRDMNFSVLGRRYGVLGVEAMLVPAWDFYRDAWMAAALVRLRGTESGYGVVRAGRESYLHVSDWSGRVLLQKRSDEVPGVGVIAHLPVGQSKATVYAVLGDWFGWLCVPRAGALVV